MIKSEKRQIDRRNSFTKSRKNQNARRKGNLQILGRKLEADTIKQAEMKEKIKKEYHRR